MRYPRFAAITISLIGLLMLASVAHAARIPSPLQPATTPEPNPVSSGNTGSTTTTNTGNAATYVVKQGETLFKIAVRFNLTVQELAAANGITNPALIYAGQVLKIPGKGEVIPTAAAPAPTSPPPQPTAVPQATGTYTVQVGDTLYKIAVRFKTTTTVLIRLNNLTNPNIVYIGQVLKVPTEGSAAPAPTPVPTAQSGQPAAPTAALAPVGYGFDYGIEAFTTGQDLGNVTSQISQLGMHWVKQTIYWRDIEPVRGQIDFATLDEIVNRFTSANLKILFTVTSAPAWARSYILENGPSDNLADYGTFVAALAQRYVGRVQAYEIWNEPNLRSQWSCTESSDKPSFCAAKYSDLLNIAYNAIKGADASAVVISAGLAPTGYNDGVNAIDDRVFLKDLYAAGLANMSDAIGAHPLGWANPPDSACCTAPEGVSTHFENPSFFFRNTLDDYRKIIVDNKDSGTPIWVTKFGWGTSEDTSPPDKNNIFVSYTSLDEQATYVTRAFELATELGFIGPMFLSNLNGCQAGGDVESCYYSLIAPDGSPRPSYEKLRALLAPTGEALPAVQPTAAVPEPATSTSEQVVPTIESTPSPQPIPEVTAIG